MRVIFWHTAGVNRSRPQLGPNTNSVCVKAIHVQRPYTYYSVWWYSLIGWWKKWILVQIHKNRDFIAIAELISNPNADEIPIGDDILKTASKCSHYDSLENILRILFKWPKSVWRKTNQYLSFITPNENSQTWMESWSMHRTIFFTYLLAMLYLVRHTCAVGRSVKADG